MHFLVRIQKVLPLKCDTLLKTKPTFFTKFKRLRETKRRKHLRVREDPTWHHSDGSILDFFKLSSNFKILISVRFFSKSALCDFHSIQSTLQSYRHSTLASNCFEIAHFFYTQRLLLLVLVLDSSLEEKGS